MRINTVKTLQTQQSVKLLFFSLLILMLTLAFTHLRFSQYFPIKIVQIYGINHLQKNEVQEVINPLIQKSFFTINIDHIRYRLMQVPWVDSALVRRIWPNRIEIIIHEKIPVARWNKTSLIGSKGEIFNPPLKSYPDNLPNFYGNNDEHLYMLQYYTDMSQSFAPLHVKISSLELTSANYWKLVLDNGIKLRIGHKDSLTRLNHFVKVYPKIIGNREADVDYIDLRYANGVAVRWKAPIKA